MSKTGVTKIDVASLKVTRGEADANRYHHFVSAIETASRLGYAVTIRVINDGYAEQPKPVDLVVEAHITAQ